MSGHSKWSQIKRQKGANDAKRGALFTKLTREIITAARQGGGDLDANYRLRMAVDKAKRESMPADNIKRAIERATGGGADAEQYEEITYEGLGPANVAVIVATMTDNRNRTASEARHAFTKYGGNLGTDGSVSYLFKALGVLSYPAGASEDALMEAALEAGAHDVVTAEDGSLEVLTAPEAFGEVKAAMEAAGLAPESAEITLRAYTASELDAESAEKVLRLIDMLEDLDDVQEVYTNAEISDDVLEAIGAG